MNTDWIKDNLTTLFAGAPSIEEISYLISTKIRRFSGKLYKYCSFSKDDSNHSLSNLRDGIIYFSKPSNFNDPFDCALGFSIDEALKSMIPSLIDKNVNIGGENEELIKELMKTLFCDESETVTYDNPTLEVAKILFSAPQIVDIIKSVKNGEKIDDDLLQSKLQQMLFDPTIASKLTGLGLNSQSSLNMQSISKNNIYTTIFQSIFRNPALMELFGEQEIPPEAMRVTSAMSAILSEDTIIGKIERLTELTEYNGKDIRKEIEKIHNTLNPIIPKIKDIINSRFAITCFSTSPDNILMWSHYANKHKGFCVEYDFSKMRAQNILLMLYPAIYSEKRPVVPMTLFDLDNLNDIKLSNDRNAIPDIIMALLTKSKIWDYENEWRIIATQSDLDEQKLKEDIAVKVYYGANIDEEDKKQLDKIVEEKGLETQQYALDVDTFKLIVK
ncbi:MAG: DUF2971 domain-containing protein [Clostridia bacterium]|nr:DUF2971 domain-containing protein [Clostridia bacterium]